MQSVRGRAPLRRTRLGLACALAWACFSERASAVDGPKVGGTPIKLDITETSIFAQRFEARQGEKAEDQGYFAWLNRLNLVFGWKKLTLGMRLDSSVYALRPADRYYGDLSFKRNAIVDGAARYRNAIYPAKLWLSYKTEGIEATAGDSYVQFGRGLVLSMRKVDELGIDTTLFGGKVVFQKDPFAVTLIAGVANPARVDEPTGQALFLPRDVRPDLAKLPPPFRTDVRPTPVFGSDRIVGVQIQAGRGLPVTSSTHFVRLTKCSPYHFKADGTAEESFTDAPFGTCDQPDTSTFLGTLSGNLSPTLRSPETINAGQVLEVASLWGHGSIYVEGAVQRRQGDKANDGNTTGNAIYGALVTTGGPITNTLEVKSYRNFFPLTGAVNVSKAPPFANIAYSAPPTAEPIISDVMFGFYNACVTGGRDRFDYRFTPTFLGYATAGYAVTRSEVPGGQCERIGRSTSDKPDETTNYVTDGSLGIEWRFDNDKSIAFANVAARHDIKETGTAYYRELSAQYSVTKYIKGPYSVEVAGRHRYRILENENIREDFRGDPWRQGENQIALKVAPKWIIAQGFEYTTQIGFPTYYFNGTVLYRITPESNIRLYVGQNRGGLRCVSGICRMFPAFSGARIELTLRF